MVIPPIGGGITGGGLGVVPPLKLALRLTSEEIVSWQIAKGLREAQTPPQLLNVEPLIVLALKVTLVDDGTSRTQLEFDPQTIELKVFVILPTPITCILTLEVPGGVGDGFGLPQVRAKLTSVVVFDVPTLTVPLLCTNPDAEACQLVVVFCATEKVATPEPSVV